MVEDILMQKYGDYLDGIDIYEKDTSMVLAKIVVKDEFRDTGIGSKVMSDLISYADKNNKIIVLTPSNSYGGNKNRLISFYQRFGFKPNKGSNKNFEFRDSMIRVPNVNENMKAKIKSLLRESLLSQKDSDVRQISDFINFAKKHLGITDDVKVALAYERTPDLTTTAYYDLNGLVKIYVKNRAIIDICRSIAHELVHHKQNLEGRLSDVVKDGEDGSTIENEANAVAGVIIRKYGKLHPELYK